MISVTEPPDTNLLPALESSRRATRDPQASRYGTCFSLQALRSGTLLFSLQALRSGTLMFSFQVLRSATPLFIYLFIFQALRSGAPCYYSSGVAFRHPIICSSGVAIRHLVILLSGVAFRHPVVFSDVAIWHIPLFFFRFCVPAPCYLSFKRRHTAPRWIFKCCSLAHPIISLQGLSSAPWCFSFRHCDLAPYYFPRVLESGAPYYPSSVVAIWHPSANILAPQTNACPHKT